MPQKNGIYCEVAVGSLVAYLIDVNDKDIEHPHARIHIKRLESESGHNIVIPEKKVYGNNVEGFLDTVKNWIDERQKVPNEKYEMKSEVFSDTLSKYYGLTLQEQLELVEEDPENMYEIDNPHKDAISRAVMLNRTLFAEYANEINEDTQIRVVEQFPESIKFINNPSPNVQLAAVRKNYNSINFIKNPDKKVIKEFKLLSGDKY
jgi:hypothetical protein